MTLRQPLILALAGVTATLAACGSSNSTSSSSSSSGGGGSSSSSSSGGGATDAKSLTVTEADLAGTNLKQASDGTLANVPNTVQRVFANADASMKFEVDVVVDTSATQAATDFTQFDTSAKGQVPNITSTTHPSGSNQAVSYVGDDGSGGIRYAEAWQRGQYIVVILGRGASGVDATTFGNTYSQVVAKEDAKIPSS
jgi:hypothetical protein